MIEWEETESGLRVVDRTKTEVWVDADRWEAADADRAIDRPLDETVSGYASELRLPPALVTAHGLTADAEYKHGGDAAPLELPADDYLLNIDLNIKTYVRFSGPATVRKTADYDELRVSFPERTHLTFGFRSLSERPTHALTVPPTPEGVATAVTHLSASFQTTGPDRSYPSLRRHPPEVELGERTAVPDAVREARPDVGIELVVPDDLEHAFVAAPLAYYLQAELTVADRRTPVLRAPSADVEYAFAPLPGFQHEAADLLRRTFYLDCLVRNAGEFSWDLAELSLLDRVGIDLAETYEASPAEQLATYLDAPYGRIDDELPEWHLAMHVAPTAENARALPYLLNDMSLVYLPESSELEEKELLNKSIDDFYRHGDPESEGDPRAVAPDATVRAGPGPVASVDRRAPVLHRGRVNGWLADGVPIDVFKSVPEAYRNRFDYLDAGDGDDSADADIDVTVVLNDAEMADEHEMVADIYRERSEDLPIDISVREQLTKSELAAVFESPRDFVHYIGHCEDDGLRCSNGHLPISAIEESNVQTFFLNACGSYYEGRDLVAKGSVAGAVTFTKVLNKQAAKVGVAFARLLINGFSIQQALEFARRRIMMGKDYAVVGDGTHVLTQCDNFYPAVIFLEDRGDDYRLDYHQTPLGNVGGAYEVYLDQSDKMNLNGSRATFTLGFEELVAFLDRAKTPTIYDGDLYWSKELVSTLRD